jgi:ubiquinone/menaquinone biosynthesis C-methylase UbiE
MADHVCPPFIGYWLLNPLRKLLENPIKILGPFVQEGMTVLEPGPAMGFFTLPLARMVGPQGKVVVVEVQQKMLDVLQKRARKKGLVDRIDSRLVKNGDMGLSDLEGKVDFAAAIHVVHEVPDAAAFFKDIFSSLKPGGRLLVVEPKGHVKPKAFAETLDTAEKAGFTRADLPHKIPGRSALLRKPE